MLDCQALSPNPYSPNPLGPTPTQIKTQISPKGPGADTKIMGATTSPAEDIPGASEQASGQV